MTAGNPFFIEEVLKACVAEGAIFQAGWAMGAQTTEPTEIPRTVQIAVQQRVVQLSPAAQRVLTLAAVAGQRWDFDLLLRMSGTDELAMIDWLKELVAAQLVVEEAADHFVFRHALTQQAIYSGLLARERRLLHRTVAQAMEQMHDTVHSSDTTDASLSTSTAPCASLAYHFEAARVWDKTLLYARRAGELAQALQSPRAAIEQFTRGINAAQQLALPPPLDLLRARGQAFELLGDFAAARSDLETGLAQAQVNGDRQAEWQALLDLGFLWTSRDFARASEPFQQALTIARTLADQAKLAATLNRIGNCHVNMEQPYEGRRCHEEALTLFQALADQPGVAATLDLLAGAVAFWGRPTPGHDLLYPGRDAFSQPGGSGGDWPPVFLGWPFKDRRRSTPCWRSHR